VTDPTPARDLTPESEALVARLYRWDENHHSIPDEYREGKARLIESLTAIEAAARADEAAALRAEVERLRGIVRKYAAHIDGCSCNPQWTGYLNRPCDCGLRESVEWVESAALAAPEPAAAPTPEDAA